MLFLFVAEALVRRASVDSQMGCDMTICSVSWMCSLPDFAIPCAGCTLCADAPHHDAALTPACAVAFADLEQERGLSVLPAKNDGNCFFYALARLAGGQCSPDGTCRGAHGLRSRTVAQLREQADELQPFLDEPVSAYADRMARDKSWTGVLEVSAAAAALGQRIRYLVVDTSRTPAGVQEHAHGEGPEVQLVLCDHHWVPVVPAGIDPAWLVTPQAPQVPVEPAGVDPEWRYGTAPQAGGRVAPVVPPPAVKAVAGWHESCACGQAASLEGMRACCGTALICSRTAAKCKPDVGAACGFFDRCATSGPRGKRNVKCRSGQCVEV